MAGRYNTWIRKALIDRLKGRGYHSDRKQYALSYTVQFYESIDTAEEASALLIKHGHFVNETDLAIQFPNFEDLFGEMNTSPWEIVSYAQAQLVNNLTDDEGFMTWGPETAKRYGFDYTGDGAERAFEVVFHTLGRGGKHVVVVEFDGVSLDADLAECIAGEDWENTGSVSNQWCRKLMGMMDEWDVMLTTANAHECGKYYMTDYIARELGLFD